VQQRTKRPYTASLIRAASFLLLFTATNASLVLLYPFDWERFFFCFVAYTTGTLTTLYLLFHPRNQFLVANRSRVESNGRRRVALTFDDGPNAEHTPRLLDILGEKGVKATFFVVGKEVEKRPDLLRRMVAEGHLPGNHTYSHPSLFCFLSPAGLRREIERGQQAIREACGVAPQHFRSPVGLRHPLLQKRLEEAGLEYISWQVRAFDTRLQESDAIAQRIVENTAAGDVILLHDRPGAASERMLNALPKIIEELRTRGFEFVLL